MDPSLLSLIFGIGGISGLAVMGLHYAPKIQSYIDNSIPNSNTTSSSDKTLQPLYEIFYEFNHNSSDEWIQWMKKQDSDIREKAVLKLNSYLSRSAQELGVVTKEAIKAVAALNQANAFDILHALFQSCKSALATQKSIGTFYDFLGITLMKLDQKKAIRILRNTIDELKDRQDLLDIQVLVIKALASATTMDSEFEDAVAAVILGRIYDITIRREMIYQTKDFSLDFKERMFERVINYILEDNLVQVVNKENAEVLKEIFQIYKELIVSNSEKAWGLYLKACYSELTQELFLGLMTSYIANPQEKLSSDQLRSLNKTQDPIRVPIKEALIRRFNLDEAEVQVCRSRLIPEDINYPPISIRVERSKKTRSVVSELLGEYHSLEKIVNQDASQNSKVERKNNHGIALITGSAAKEKIYLCRSLASNMNRAFIYIDLEELILEVSELNKLISTISNSKPAIVFVDNLYNILMMDLNDEQMFGLKSFNKTLKELSILPSVSFFGNLPTNSNDIQLNKPLSAILNSTYKGSYKISINIEKPSAKDIQILLNNYISRLQGSRVSEEFLLDSVLGQCQDFSLLEAINYFTEFFQINILVFGLISSKPDMPTGDIDFEEEAQELNESPNDQALSQS